MNKITKVLLIIVITLASLLGVVMYQPTGASANSVTSTLSNDDLSPDQTTTVTINGTASTDISGYEVRINFNPSVVEVVTNSAQVGTLLPASDGFTINTPLINNETGRVVFAAVSTGGAKKTGSGTIGTFQLKAKTTGDATLSYELVQFVDANSEPISPSKTIASFTVREEQGSGGGNKSTGDSGTKGGTGAAGGTSDTSSDNPEKTKTLPVAGSVTASLTIISIGLLMIAAGGFGFVLLKR